MTPTVDTSVAVAMPSTTAARMRKGKASAGRAMTKARNICRGVARRTPVRLSPRVRKPATMTRASAPTSAGSSPPVKSAAIDTPVTEPMVMRTRLGGIVSLIAPEAESRATSSPGRAPRRFISGKSTGATAAMSAAFEPEMPETRYIAPRRT